MNELELKLEEMAKVSGGVMDEARKKEIRIVVSSAKILNFTLERFIKEHDFMLTAEEVAFIKSIW